MPIVGLIAGAAAAAHSSSTFGASPVGSIAGRAHVRRILTWRPVVDDRSKASMTSTTWLASVPFARCGRPRRKTE
jgi:hypothetical protein